jgi:hypothetical protein
VYNLLMVYPKRPPQVFLSIRQVEARIGLRPGGLASAELPPPDAIIGPVKKGGSLPQGSMRGWLPETIDYWKRTRLGQGFRAATFGNSQRTSGGGPRSRLTGRSLPKKSEK